MILKILSENIDLRFSKEDLLILNKRTTINKYNIKFIIILFIYIL